MLKKCVLDMNGDKCDIMITVPTTSCSEETLSALRGVADLGYSLPQAVHISIILVLDRLILVLDILY